MFGSPVLSGKFGKQSLRFRAAKTFFFGITIFFWVTLPFWYMTHNVSVGLPTRTFLKQDVVSNDPDTFSYVMKIYERACAHTKTSQIAWERGFFGLTTEQMHLQFQGHRCTWRSCVYLKLQRLCSRLRLGVAQTHSDVNSWPSRFPSSEHPLLPCMSAHFLRSVGRSWKSLYLSHCLWKSTTNYSSFNSKKYSSLYCLL